MSEPNHVQCRYETLTARQEDRTAGEPSSQYQLFRLNFKDKEMTNRPKRWIATVTFRHDAGVEKIEHNFEEIEDLQSIVENPDRNFFTIVDIRIALHPRRNILPNLTVERACSL